MSNRKEITVIGATGNLGVPVVKFLLRSGYRVKAIVRNMKKAKSLLGHEAGIELVQADITDVASLKSALVDTEYLYLNLSTETMDVNIPFAVEREGMANIVEALDKKVVKQVIAISGLGAFDNLQKPVFKFIPNIIRKQGHKILKNSGIPYTILHCTWFVDSFVLYQRKGVYSAIGDTKNPIYFTNAYDYTCHLIKAIDNKEALFKEFPIQGKEGVKHMEAAKLFLDIYSKEVKVKALPGAVIRMLALFKKEMKYLKHMSDYFSKYKDSFIAEECDTYKVLGEPELGIEEYARLLKLQDIYS